MSFSPLKPSVAGGGPPPSAILSRLALSYPRRKFSTADLGD
jgi:hypothetical protein